MEKNYSLGIVKYLFIGPLFLLVVLTFGVFYFTKNVNQFIYVLVTLDIIAAIFISIAWFFFGNIKIDNENLIVNYIYTKLTLPIRTIQQINMVNGAASDNLLEKNNFSELFDIKPINRLEVADTSGNIYNLDTQFFVLKPKNRKLLVSLLSQNKQIIINDSLNSYLAGDSIVYVAIKDIAKPKAPVWITIFVCSFVLLSLTAIAYLIFFVAG